MRSDRRHELKENDLAHAIDQWRGYFKTHGKTVGLVIAAAVAVVLVTSLALRAREAGIEDNWSKRSLLSFDDPESARTSLTQLQVLANSSSDKAFVLSTLLTRGSQALGLCLEAENAPDEELNNVARESYERVLKSFTKNPIAIGRAHLGLATVAENDFALDGDIDRHKAEAVKHLKAVMDDARLQTTPFYRLAQSRCDSIDETFTVVTFAPPLFPDATAGEDSTVQLVPQTLPTRRITLTPDDAGKSLIVDDNGIQPAQQDEQFEPDAGTEPATDE